MSSVGPAAPSSRSIGARHFGLSGGGRTASDNICSRPVGCPGAVFLMNAGAVSCVAVMRFVGGVLFFVLINLAVIVLISWSFKKMDLFGLLAKKTSCWQA